MSIFESHPLSLYQYFKPSQTQILSYSMRHRKLPKSFESPENDKQNQNKTNFLIHSQQKTACTKRFTLKFIEDDFDSDTQNQTINLPLMTTKHQQITVSYYIESTKAKNKYPSLSKQYQESNSSPIKQKRNQSNYTNIQPNRLDFAVSQEIVQNDTNGELQNVTIYQSINFKDFLTGQIDESLFQQYEEQTRQYDMDSDKQNRPPSEEQDVQDVSSSDYGSTQEDFYQNQNQFNENNRSDSGIKRFYYSNKQKLPEISQTQQNSETYYIKKTLHMNFAYKRKRCTYEKVINRILHQQQLCYSNNPKSQTKR